MQSYSKLICVTSSAPSTPRWPIYQLGSLTWGLAAAGLDRIYVGAVERMEVNISMDNAEKLARAFGLRYLGSE